MPRRWPGATAFSAMAMPCSSCDGHVPKDGFMQIEVTTTRLTPAEAELSLAAAPDGPVATDLELRGRLMGPRSAYAETVEVAYNLRPRPTEGDLVRARVLI